MKKLLLLSLILCLTGCSTLHKPKRTDFYKNGRLVKSFVGRGVYSGDDWLGSYKIWAMKDWHYYEYTCIDCQVVETEIKQ